MTPQLVVSLLAAVVSNAVLIFMAAWHLSARLTRIEARLSHLEIAQAPQRTTV